MYRDRDRDELLAFVHYGKLPRPPDGPGRPRGRWRGRWRRRIPVVPPRPLAPDPVAPQLDIHEYLELEFAVGEGSRR